MKPALTRVSSLYHYKDGKRIDGPSENIYGDCSDLRGNCSGLIGNLDDCEITEEERERGVNITDLIKPQKS